MMNVPKQLSFLYVSLSCGFLFLFMLSVVPAFSAASGAKALFAHEGGVTVQATEPKKVQPKGKTEAKKKDVPAEDEYLGLSYWIELIEPDGKAARTTTSRVFQSGDRVKLNFQSNRDGYLYVLGLGSTGSSQVLFPNASETSNGIKTGNVYTVPGFTNLKFDNNPGEETLLVILSQKPLREFSPGLKTLPGSDTQPLVAAAQTFGAKDLLLEEEDLGASPAKYAVVPLSVMSEENLKLVIKLKHQ